MMGRNALKHHPQVFVEEYPVRIQIGADSAKHAKSGIYRFPFLRGQVGRLAPVRATLETSKDGLTLGEQPAIIQINRLVYGDAGTRPPVARAQEQVVRRLLAILDIPF